MRDDDTTLPYLWNLDEIEDYSVGGLQCSAWLAVCNCVETGDGVPDVINTS